MKLKKGLIIGICVSVLLVIFAFIYLWSLGVFSGSAGIGPRNKTVEAAVVQELNARLSQTFDAGSGFSLVSAESYAAMYQSRFPEGSVLSPEDIDKAIYEEQNNITIELTFQGPRLTFDEYKVLVYEIMEVIRDKMDWSPLSMQVFYQRYPEGSESSNILAYESRIPSYLFGKDQSTVVKSSGTHYKVELDEETEKKANIYFTTKNIYLTVVSLTVIALSALLIVRTVRKHRRYKR